MKYGGALVPGPEWASGADRWCVAVAGTCDPEGATAELAPGGGPKLWWPATLLWIAWGFVAGALVFCGGQPCCGARVAAWGTPAVGAIGVGYGWAVCVEFKA